MSPSLVMEMSPLKTLPRWRPPIHICSESSLNPSTFVREQFSHMASNMPAKPGASMMPTMPGVSMMPSSLSGLFRKRTSVPTVVLENLCVQVGACVEPIATFPIYVEGQTHVVIHKCEVLGQRLSAILVSKGAQCDVIDSDISGAAEDGVFYVFGGGSVRGCRIHGCQMNAIEVQGAAGDVVIEHNVLSENGCGLHVPCRAAEPATNLDAWQGRVFFHSNQVMHHSGPSLRIENCEANPHVAPLHDNELMDNAEHRSEALTRVLQQGLCSRTATGEEHDYQPWFESH